MAHNGVGGDLAFLHKKPNRGLRSNRPLRACVDKETSETKVSHTRNVLSTITAPIN